MFLNINSVKDCLHLWLKILVDIAKDGISMNLLTYRYPDVIYWSDACNFGIGGYCPRGNAWRWKIPHESQHRAHINLLEFLAEMICIWIVILNKNLHPDDCVLCFGDSTTAMGWWLHCSNFRQKDKAIEHYNTKTTVARHLAQLVLNYRIKLYSQWLQGQRNGLADALSRDDSTMPDDLLTLDLSSRFPTQVPHNFKICPLLLHLQSTSSITKAAATTSRYKKLGDRTWTQWTDFLTSIGLSTNPFLLSFAQHNRSEIFTLFAQSIREARPYSNQPGGVSSMAEGTIQNTLSMLAQTFLENHATRPLRKHRNWPQTSISRIQSSR
jgi:hypothetical protein